MLKHSVIGQRRDPLSNISIVEKNSRYYFPNTPARSLARTYVRTFVLSKLKVLY